MAEHQCAASIVCRSVVTWSFLYLRVPYLARFNATPDILAIPHVAVRRALLRRARDDSCIWLVFSRRLTIQMPAPPDPHQHLAARQRWRPIEIVFWLASLLPFVLVPTYLTLA